MSGGTRAHMPTMRPITLTTLEKSKELEISNPSSMNGWRKGAHKGCKLCTPNFDAIVPVMKGTIAEPV